MTLILFANTPHRALRRLHEDAARFSEQSTALRRLTTEHDNWLLQHRSFAGMSSHARVALLALACVLPATVLLDMLMIAPAGQQLAFNISGGNAYCGYAGMVLLPLAVALVELALAHHIDERRQTGESGTLLILLWILVSLIPIFSGYFAVQGIMAASGQNGDDLALGLTGAALIAVMHFGMILTAGKVIEGWGYLAWSHRQKCLARAMRRNETRLARVRRRTIASWQHYFHVLGNPPSTAPGPFSRDVAEFAREVFGVRILNADGEETAPQLPQPEPAAGPLIEGEAQQAQPAGATEAAEEGQAAVNQNPVQSSQADGSWTDIRR
jgi:hypothetical protein